jgi:hypothetical protein
MTQTPAISITILALGTLLSGAFSVARGAQAVPIGARNASQPAVEQTTNPVIAVGPDGRISARIDNRSLGETLRLMSEKSLFDIKGALPSGEIISITFSDLTLKEALTKLMRGYNYVVVNQGAMKRPFLMVLGKVERASGAEQRPPQAAPPPQANQAPDPSTYYVPPTIVDPPPPAARATQPGSPGRGRLQSPQTGSPGGQQGLERQPAGETEERGPLARPENSQSDEQPRRAPAQQQQSGRSEDFPQQGDGSQEGTNPQTPPNSVDSK